MKIGAGCDVFAMPSAPSPFIVACVSVAVSLACVEGVRCVYDAVLASNADVVQSANPLRVVVILCRSDRFPAARLPVRHGVQACTLSASCPLCLVLKTTMKGSCWRVRLTQHGTHPAGIMTGCGGGHITLTSTRKISKGFAGSVDASSYRRHDRLLLFLSEVEHTPLSSHGHNTVFISGAEAVLSADKSDFG